MKNKPNLILILCPKIAAFNPDEIHRLIQPQMPEFCASISPRGISPIQTAIQSSGIRLDMRRVL